MDHYRNIDDIKQAILKTKRTRHIGATPKKQSAYGLDKPQVKYQPARIIECTQNVIELRKLLNNWHHIDVAQKKSLTKMENEKLSWENHFNRILGEPISELEDSFELEPGFRFKSNGDIKKTNRGNITKVVEYIKNWQAVKQHMRERERKRIAPGKVKNENRVYLNIQIPCAKIGWGDMNVLDAENLSQSDCSEGDIVDKAIEETEMALQEIWSDIEMNEAQKRGRSTQSSQCFLRALSRENCYSGGPYAVKSNRQARHFCSRNFNNHPLKSRGFKNNCVACEFKLSGRGNPVDDDTILRGLRKPLEKWKDLQSGKFPNLYSNKTS